MHLSFKIDFFLLFVVRENVFFKFALVEEREFLKP